ncbi:MAG TPA: hypothetical protein VFS47_04850 [Steroidobacteraceae bacterium]|nr:hypothetical protein [Steroidobacteraceae bacterium]
MRPFLITVGILAWAFGMAVLFIFSQSGGVMTAIAAGVFAGVGLIALGCERILKTLEEIRDGTRPLRRTVVTREDTPRAVTAGV